MSAAGGDASGGGDFSVGERVFVPHTDKHYEAKILKAEFRRNAEHPGGIWFYFVHYSGWNKKFDEWVESTGLMKSADMGVAQPNPAAVKAAAAAPRGKQIKERFAGGVAAKSKKQLAAELGAIGGGTVGGMAGAAAAGAGTDAAGGPGGAGGAGGAPRGLQLELDISPILKKALLDDYDAVVTDARLAPLPRTPCVAEVLRRYCEQAGKGGSSAVEQEVAAGLRTYFDKALMGVLLYRSERPQAMAFLADGRLPSSVYGTEHLLRLFVKLPDLLAAAGVAGMSEEALATTALALQDLMAWLAENLDYLLAPKETYMDHYDFMASLTGELAEAVAAAGFAGTNARGWMHHPAPLLGPNAGAAPAAVAAGGGGDPMVS